MVVGFDAVRSPGFKLTLAIMVGLALTVPLFSVWLLVYDRQSQQQEATNSITAGWGAAQVMSGPVLVIPYRTPASGSPADSGASSATRELVIAPESAAIATEVRPQVRKRSMYEAVIYDALNSGHARFTLPPDLARSGVGIAQMDFGSAELRFSVSDPRGLGADAQVKLGATPLRLEPGGGGFLAPVDATNIQSGPLDVDFTYGLRGNQSLGLSPQSADTRWTVHSSWPSPSFAGDFLPDARQVTTNGFTATYRIGNLALGHSLVSTGYGVDLQPSVTAKQARNSTADETPAGAQINLIQPVDLYSQVNRATKYGFLFIGFTFLALLMFDIIGGVHVSAVEYLQMGAALILFFVLLLAFAEVIGFTAAYLLASAAIAGLNTAYSAAVLGSWRRAGFIGALLACLYAVLYVLLSLEAYALLIGSLLLFAALAAVMYTTRRIDWAAPRPVTAAGDGPEYWR